MSGDRTVTIRIPAPLLAAAARAARAEEMTAGDFIRAALAERVAAASGAGDAVSTLRRALRRDFAEAADWPDLQRRLRAQGFVLRAVEGRVWIHTWPLERRLLPLARLGVTVEDLTLLYRAPFPADGREVPRAGARPAAAAPAVPFPVRRVA
ncbi:MAG: hypothetical protein N2Z62_13885 [Rhodobacteraceae bacterium]|nr:hypothetical protein [Paracoccaceae bacterium]